MTEVVEPSTTLVATTEGGMRSSVRSSVCEPILHKNLSQEPKLWVAPLLVVLSAIVLRVSSTFELSSEYTKATEALGVLIVVVMWFLSEVVPISIASFLPIVLYPLMGVATANSLAGSFYNGTSFIFVTGLFISLAVERWGLHQRILTHVAAVFGARIDTLIGGFMAAVWFLSMWISNTATTLSVMPAARAFLLTVPEETHPNFHQAFLCVIAFSATIGGMATPVGTTHARYEILRESPISYLPTC